MMHMEIESTESAANVEHRFWVYCPYAEASVSYTHLDVYKRQRGYDQACSGFDASA